MRRFEFDDGTSRKFWEIGSDGPKVVVRFGRLGTEGQTQAKDLGATEAAEAEITKLIASKIKKGYAERGEAGTTRAITVERGMRQYMADSSGACHVLVRDADDVEAATRALRQFCEDLWTADLFAKLDGEFGDEEDGTPIRYTPSFATAVQRGDEGPEFWFDADDILECWPELVNSLLDRLKMRLREAGVEQAQIGKPSGS